MKASTGRVKNSFPLKPASTSGLPIAQPPFPSEQAVSAQASALGAWRALVQVAVNRQIATIALIQALGGGWERIETP